MAMETFPFEIGKWINSYIILCYFLNCCRDVDLYYNKLNEKNNINNLNLIRLYSVPEICLVIFLKKLLKIFVENVLRFLIDLPGSL